MPLKRYLFFLLFVCEMAASAKVRRDNFRDIRWLGRGNTGIANIRDGTAAFYNPAGIARNDSYSISILNPSVGSNQNVVTSYSVLPTLMGDSEQTLGERFEPLLGLPLAVQGSILPYVLFPNFMIGFYDYLDLFAEYRDPVFPTLDVNLRNDYGYILGGGFSLLGMFWFGGSLRYFKRQHVEQSLATSSVYSLSGADLTSLLYKGEAWALNLGFQGQHALSSFHNISYGFLWEDVGETAFRNGTGLPTPSTQAQKMSAGLAMELKLGRFKGQILFDLRDFLNDVSFTKKIFTGIEISTMRMDFRGGFFQGYWTAGYSFRIIPLLHLDLTTYAEELDTAAGVRQNRFWMAGITMGVDIKGGSGSGGRKKKKQRAILDKF